MMKDLINKIEKRLAILGKAKEEIINKMLSENPDLRAINTAIFELENLLKDASKNDTVKEKDVEKAKWYGTKNFRYEV